jgi:hypothetical protein
LDQNHLIPCFLLLVLHLHQPIFANQFEYIDFFIYFWWFLAKMVQFNLFLLKRRINGIRFWSI